MPIYSSLFALAAFAALAIAAPSNYLNNSTGIVETRGLVHVEFRGHAGAAFSQYIPMDGQLWPLMDVLSISSIMVCGDADCCATGIDGGETKVQGAGLVDVAPPQTQVNIRCRPHTY